jgi:hypothetical protein
LPYALAVAGPLGFLLNENAFQQGTLTAPVLSIITVCDPLISIALAYLWLNENFSSNPRRDRWRDRLPVADDHGDRGRRPPCSAYHGSAGQSRAAGIT